MAGDWMKIELELPDKPEVHSIASMLNIEPDSVVGKLIRIWQWFDKHTTDGNAYGVTYSLPDRISGVSGFGEAMSFVGWLEQRDKTLHMPKFDRHTSASAKARALTAKRVDKSRSKSNADTVTENVTSPLAREEKRREDIKTEPTSAEVEPSKLPKNSPVTLKSFLEKCDASGDDAIAADDPVFDYAEKVGLSEDMLHLCWLEFKDIHLGNGKRQKDWRATYRNAVRSNWYRLWFIGADGKAVATSQGRQAANLHGGQHVSV